MTTTTRIMTRPAMKDRLVRRYALTGLLSLLTLFGTAEAAEQGPRKIYTLEDVLGVALERNPRVTSAEAVVDQTVGRRIAAGAYPNPTITGYTGHGILRDAGRIAADIEEVRAREQLWEYNASIGQPLEWPSKRAARQRAADAGVAGATAGLVETRLNLTADVKVAFYELLLAQREAELARQNLRIMEDVQRIVKARVRLGEAPQFDAIKAEVEVLKANQTVTRADNIVRVSRVILDTLTVGALGTDYEIRGDFVVFPQGLSAEHLVRRATEEHPTLLRLARVIEQASRSVEFQRYARVPDFTVNGSYVREIGREAVLAGVSVPTPIWYQRQGEIAEALGAKRREEADFLRTRHDILRAINQHFEDAKTTAELIEVFEKGLLRQSEEALRIAQFSFRQGAASLLEVLDAQRVLRQILFDYTRARFELSISLTRLQQAAGGVL